MIINAFKRTAEGEIIDAIAAKTQGEVVSCKSQTKFGSCEQLNTDLVVFEKMFAVSVSFRSIVNAF